MLNYVPNFWQHYWWSKIITLGGSRGKMALGLFAKAFCVCHRNLRKKKRKRKREKAIHIAIKSSSFKLSFSLQLWCYITCLSVVRQSDIFLSRRSEKIQSKEEINLVSEEWGLIRLGSQPWRALVFKKCIVTASAPGVANGPKHPAKLIHDPKVNY